MELDLNKFRTLIPISALYDDNLLHLASRTRVARLQCGDVVFNIGDEDTDSVFLMSGTIRETSHNRQAAEISAGSEESLYALANFKPRQFKTEVVSESATLAWVDTLLLEKLLAWGQFSPDLPPSEKRSSTGGKDAEQTEWMMSMLNTAAFLRLPAANIQSLFSRLEELPVKAKDTILSFGEPGDYFYFIKQGKCKVYRPVGSGEHMLAELGPCDSFGEEALISDAPRNATVTMVTDGKLMRLAKQDFVELMEEPLLDWVDAQAASNLISEGAIRIDVRLESEFEKLGLPGTINIPLHRLREEATTLNRFRKYVLYCDSGQRSSVGAFLLRQLGFDVYVLKGGISRSAGFARPQG